MHVRHVASVYTSVAFNGLVDFSISYTYFLHYKLVELAEPQSRCWCRCHLASKSGIKCFIGCGGKKGLDFGFRFHTFIISHLFIVSTTLPVPGSLTGTCCSALCCKDSTRFHGLRDPKNSTYEQLRCSNVGVSVKYWSLYSLLQVFF